MYKMYFYVLIFICFNFSNAQVLKFGTCVDVDTMKYFELEKFLGTWYEIERFPTWYEDYGACALKRIHQCGRHIEIEHVYVKDGIEYVLHVNSSYNAGDDAVFVIQENNIDPIGIPLSVITTDYSNYAIIYGCKNSAVLDLMYTWILSRTPTLQPDVLSAARQELAAAPFASPAYLEPVEQSSAKCAAHWTAHVQAVSVNDQQ